MNIEDRYKLCDRHQFMDTLRHVHKLECSAFFVESNVACNKLAQSACINVLDPGEVQEDLNLSFSSKAANRLVESYSGAADSFPTLKIEDRHVFNLPFIYIKINHWCSFKLWNWY